MYAKRKTIKTKAEKKKRRKKKKKTIICGNEMEGKESLRCLGKSTLV